MYTEEQVVILNAHAEGRSEVVEAVKHLLNHFDYLSQEDIKKELARIIEQYKR